MSKKNAIEPAEIPPHMLDDPQSKAQKKAFAKVKRAEAKEEAKHDEKPAAKKSTK